MISRVQERESNAAAANNDSLPILNLTTAHAPFGTCQTRFRKRSRPAASFQWIKTTNSLHCIPQIISVSLPYFFPSI